VGSAAARLFRDDRSCRSLSATELRPGFDHLVMQRLAGKPRFEPFEAARNERLLGYPFFVALEIVAQFLRRAGE
jgi:hypothetical protein